MNRYAMLATLSVAVSVLMGAYVTSSRLPAASPPDRRIEVTAHDHGFDAPDTVAAGLTTVELKSAGKEFHHAMLIRIADGAVLEEILSVLAKEELPEGVTLLGGPNAPTPGGKATVSLMLRPGRYAWVCLVPGPDGEPHVMHGMAQEFTVVPTTAPASPQPIPDYALMLGDYEFKLSKALKPGRHVIRVRNYAAQPHEVEVFRLLPGKTKEDLLGWVSAMQGPPPAVPLGGVAPLSDGQANDMIMDFEPGTYVFVCFVPDVKSGRAHLVHGMVAEYEVTAG